MNDDFESISAGLNEAIAHAKGNRVEARVHEFLPVDVKAVRSKLGMSQREFASSFGISLGTMRHWEQGLREPRRPARVLLQVVQNESQAVLSALEK